MAVDSVMFGFARKTSTTRHWRILQHPDGSSGMRPLTIMEAVCSIPWVKGHSNVPAIKMSQPISPFLGWSKQQQKRRVNNVSISDFHPLAILCDLFGMVK